MGKQCVAMSLSTLIFKYITNIYNWHSADLNTILSHRNCIYNCIKVSVKKYFLLLTDIPNMVYLDDKIYALTCSESLTGELSMTCESASYVCLKTAFTNLFSGVETNYESCLLTIDCNTVAVFKMSNNSFKVFDSHSRDLHGIPSFSGKCVLLTTESSGNLVSFFQIISPQTSCTPFQIKGVSIILTCTDKNENNQNIPSECAQKFKVTI